MVCMEKNMKKHMELERKKIIKTHYLGKILIEMTHFWQVLLEFGVDIAKICYKMLVSLEGVLSDQESIGL